MGKNMKSLFDYCSICGNPIFAGDSAFEIGLKEKDKCLICEECKESIVPYDTQEDDEDG